MEVLLHDVHNVLQQVHKEVLQVLAVDEGGAVVYKRPRQYFEVAVHGSVLSGGQPPLEVCRYKGVGQREGSSTVRNVCVCEQCLLTLHDSLLSPLHPGLIDELQLEVVQLLEEVPVQLKVVVSGPRTRPCQTIPTGRGAMNCLHAHVLSHSTLSVLYHRCVRMW